MGEMRNACSILSEILKIKRPFGRPRCRQEDIKMNSNCIEREGPDCCEHDEQPSHYIKSRKFLDKLSYCQFLKWDCDP
jgi:hypothetical protein